ncbi:MAG TPA: cupin domain-containing protein [Myxococcales bacterium]|nr:cupin domain-containing protein [Myxococcales bacterium]
MADVTVKRIDDIDWYKGPNAIANMRFRPAARALGVTAWGMSVIEIEPGCDRYPEHDHSRDGQEEVYVLLRGSATLRTPEQEWQLETGDAVRVGPGVKRKWLPGPSGVMLLALGATPGKAYEPRR